MTIKAHHLSINRTARYYLSGEITPAVREVWMVCHGYAQLAAYFIRHFTDIATPERLIVAPEALSRFYLVGMGGDRVGASWMTREDRLAEIDDYVRYLDRLHQQITTASTLPLRTVALGFSQGTATATRWALAGNTPVDRLILWAGNMPPEFSKSRWKEPLNALSLTFVIGDEDEYANPAQVAKMRDQLDTQGITHQLVTFKGGHEMDRATLSKIASP